MDLLSKGRCGVIEEVKEPYELVGCFIGEVFEGEWGGGAMDDGEEEEPDEELSVFFGNDLLGDGSVAVSGGSRGRTRRRTSRYCGGKERGMEEEAEGFALVVGKSDGVEW